MNNVNSKEGQAGYKEGKEGAVNSTSNRSANPQSIPVDSEFHALQIYKKAT
jgi:hypothetical protein